MHQEPLGAWGHTSTLGSQPFTPAECIEPMATYFSTRNTMVIAGKVVPSVVSFTKINGYAFAAPLQRHRLLVRKL
jgi:hypothetical protein